MEKVKIPGKQKKVLLIAGLLIGIGIILAGYNMEKPFKEGILVEEKLNSIEPVQTSYSVLRQAEIALEQKLERILSQISGAGNVAVSVALKTSPELEYAINVSTSEKSITETDQAGGNRVTLDTTETGELVLLRVSGSTGEQPVIIKELKPEILGVLVVSQGANNPLLKAELTRSVQTLLGISPHQVNVVSGGE